MIKMNFCLDPAFSYSVSFRQCST